MRTPEPRTHELRENGQDACIEQKIRALVVALNRASLNIKTIASCEGHFRGIHPPYVYFQCPVTIAALIEKRLLLLSAREEGMHCSWRLEGRFNPGSQLCWRLHSYYLDMIATHGSIVEEVWACWLMRKRIDRDLTLLAETINGLLEEFSANEIPGDNNKGQECHGYQFRKERYEYQRCYPLRF